MTRISKRLGIITALALTGLLAVGVTTASAHGRGGPKGPSASALVTQAATELKVTRADLKAAIVKSAQDRITAAVEDEDITADEGDDLSEEVEDNLNVAYQVSQTRTVASNLKITTAQLNTGFRAARKALAVKTIDKALAAGDLTDAEASDAKAALDKKALAGYKAGVSSLNALAEGGRGGHCGGRGDRASSPDDSASAEDSSSTTTTASFRPRGR
ncbi:MAG: hypothetical protein ACXWYS_07070 [Gaiellaceae bacterium]